MERGGYLDISSGGGGLLVTVPVFADALFLVLDGFSDAVFRGLPLTAYADKE
eukprot:CAMPEP_0176345362 /NCGR_PEP_ID=MMETSP0126-20121128/5399_1 /TAXON_ID=141414 ORGANISM="Strombidinopsis acuminatum, Strain SPMC142" /NCGR_SAMPLE_ID=MMETSP0126 /ASSEMBLY_ACC=CAM_ASM_000229 /LENGTH=51 /DNA_ID=CAMNT_0017692297 /DNA_START=484 /DNA_END=639 /DNA_ORIENTATION=+